MANRDSETATMKLPPAELVQQLASSNRDSQMSPSLFSQEQPKPLQQRRKKPKKGTQELIKQLTTTNQSSPEENHDMVNIPSDHDESDEEMTESQIKQSKKKTLEEKARALQGRISGLGLSLNKLLGRKKPSATDQNRTGDPIGDMKKAFLKEYTKNSDVADQATRQMENIEYAIKRRGGRVPEGMAIKVVPHVSVSTTKFEKDWNTTIELAEEALKDCLFDHLDELNKTRMANIYHLIQKLEADIQQMETDENKAGELFKQILTEALETREQRNLLALKRRKERIEAAKEESSPPPPAKKRKTADQE